MTARRRAPHRAARPVLAGRVLVAGSAQTPHSLQRLSRPASAKSAELHPPSHRSRAPPHNICAARRPFPPGAKMHPRLGATRAPHPTQTHPPVRRARAAASARRRDDDAPSGGGAAADGAELGEPDQAGLVHRRPVLTAEVPWATFQTAGIITKEQLELIYELDKQPLEAGRAVRGARRGARRRPPRIVGGLQRRHDPVHPGAARRAARGVAVARAPLPALLHASRGTRRLRAADAAPHAVEPLHPREGHPAPRARFDSPSPLPPCPRLPTPPPPPAYQASCSRTRRPSPPSTRTPAEQVMRPPRIPHPVPPPPPRASHPHASPPRLDRCSAGTSRRTPSG